MPKQKTCNRCRAYEQQQYGSRCLLGFHITQLEEFEGKVISNGGDIRPIGDDGICPKPLTISKYIYWTKYYPRKSTSSILATYHVVEVDGEVTPPIG